MENETVLPSTSFIFVKTFDEAKRYPLMESMNIVILIDVLYLLAVLKVLPDMMKNRQPFQLRKTIAAYNLIQVFLSLLFVYVSGEIMLEKGILPRTAVQEDPEYRDKLAFCIYIYFLGKITELADTIFFCLRKKYSQVTFLHVYHHAATLLGTYCMVKYSLCMTAVYGCWINSLVHVVMYIYYGLSSLGPEYAKYLTWKKHITSFQLIQFVSMFLHQAASLLYTRGQHSVFGIIYVFYSTILFFYLFSQFYKSSYKTSQKADKTAQNGTLSLHADKTKTQ